MSSKKDPNSYKQVTMRLSDDEKSILLDGAKADGFTRAGKPALATWLKKLAGDRIEQLRAEGKLKD